METDEQESTGPVAPSGPGMRLREARESAGLTREEVAARLRLRLELVRALEEDDYKQLPSSAFVSGYLRSYARLLDLPAEEIVAAYVRPAAEPPLVSPVMPPRQRRSGDLPVKLVTYLIIALLVILAMVWWAARRPAVTVHHDEAPAVLKHGGTVELTLPPPSGAASATENTTPEKSPAANPPASAPATSKSAAPVAAVAAPKATPPAPVAPSAQAEIQLEAKADCWVEITDATGQRVAFELLKGGTNSTVLGKAPFDVFLGYAPGVTLYYQGKAFDMSPYEHGNKAHFHLGKASDNALLNE